MRDLIIQILGKGASIVDDPEPDLVIFVAKVIGVGEIDFAKRLAN